ncbi:hypothetical protein IOQ59_10960 [Pontibacterium sp. N1Y112]|uniref:Uncharacterized protein n=1 Tax=Pontibacterium sinense TaxID=2781979 RepID=A0A8J7FCY8_9GAMM|nr:hypothetical protein [Pontibacterium sinense]MBE9397777.1 hypothetical protein [Pontibacterium sinense]
MNAFERLLEKKLAEIAEYERKISKAQEEVAIYKEQQEKYQAIIEILVSKEEELEKVMTEHSEQKEKEELLKDNIKNRIEKFIAFSEVEDMKKRMLKLIRTKNSVNKSEFHDIQRKIEAVVDKMKDAGFVSRGLYYLTSVNYNRVDKFDLSKASKEELITLIEA